MKKLTILSLGAGVQSTCLALMAAKGEVTPMPDYCLFADTGAEPHHVMSHLEWLEEVLPFPVITVEDGNIWKDVVKSAKDGDRVANPPFYTKSKDGSKAILKRGCTEQYKLKPLKKRTRELLGFSKGQRVKDAHVETWIGISFDERTRMKMNWHDEWLQACEFDEKIRNGINKASAKDFRAEELYLHPDLVPLREVDLSTDVDRGQMTFLDECNGICMT